ncbi:MAG: hypothetical protein KAT68_19565 [Bacteroidales bacterium]|nr:hypothetical protein [Bacteroidales bacterium]
MGPVRKIQVQEERLDTDKAKKTSTVYFYKEKRLGKQDWTIQVETNI